MSCCILNFSRYISSNSGIPLTIFTVILPNISSSDLDLVVSGGKGFSFCVDILSVILLILSATRIIVLFVSWIDIFPSTGRDIFPSLGFCIVSKFPFEAVLSLFLLLEVVNYFTETTEVEKRAI